jgi:integrase
MAERRLHEMLAEIERDGLSRIERGTTFREAAESWYARKRDIDKRRPNTLRDYRSMLDNKDGILAAFADRPLDAITTREIEKWRDRRAAKASNRTANKYLVVLHGILAHAVKEYGLRDNPASGIKRLPESAEHRKRTANPLTREELWALVRAAEARAKLAKTQRERFEAEQDAVFYLVNALTGLRTGEMLALQWRDVDFAGARISVERSRDKMGKVGPPKGNRRRAVPLAADAASALAKLHARGWYTTDDGPVFISWRAWERVAVLDEHDPDPLAYELLADEPFDESALRKRMAGDAKSAGIARRTLYDLRHTFGSIAVNAPGTSLLDVQEWMGHQDIATTMRYLHYRERGDEAERLGEVFRPTTIVPEPRERAA